MDKVQSYLVCLAEAASRLSSLSLQASQLGLMHANKRTFNDKPISLLEQIHGVMMEMESIRDTMNHTIRFGYEPKQYQRNLHAQLPSRFIRAGVNAGRMSYEVSPDALPPLDAHETFTHYCDHENTNWEKISPEPNLKFICLKCNEPVE